MTIFNLGLIAAASAGSLETGFSQSSLVVRGEVTAIAPDTSDPMFSRTVYQIHVTESIKGVVGSSLVSFVAPGGGSIGSPSDFTLGFHEEVVLVAPGAQDNGSIEYTPGVTKVYSRFNGANQASLTAEVMPGNSRRPLASSCTRGDMRSTAPEPASATLPGLSGSQRAVRRVHEVTAESGCAWEAFIPYFRAMSIENSRIPRITGSVPLLDTRASTRGDWYEFREDLRARYGSEHKE